MFLGPCFFGHTRIRHLSFPPPRVVIPTPSSSRQPRHPESLQSRQPCHPESARFSSRAEEPVLSEAEGISVLSGRGAPALRFAVEFQPMFPPVPVLHLVQFRDAESCQQPSKVDIYCRKYHFGTSAFFFEFYCILLKTRQMTYNLGSPGFGQRPASQIGSGISKRI
jgi:hypothetical protein